MSSGIFDDWLTVDKRPAAGQHSVSVQVHVVESVCNFAICMRTS